MSAPKPIRNLILTFIVALVPIILAGSAADVSAQPSTPPGLLHAPPCVVEDFLPDEARVPCAGLLAFKEGISPKERGEIVKELGAEMRFNFSRINGAAVLIPNEDVYEAVMKRSEIEALIPDRRVQAMPKPPENPGKGNKGGKGKGQVVPSGVERIGAAPGELSYDGGGVGVAIVDTGIDLFHSDLVVASECFSTFGECQDEDGHGTHVGGIVGALDNDIDVVGVAPGSTLYAVRVLDRNGNGTDSTVMAGLGWIADNAGSVTPPIKVVNMSLGRRGELGDNPLLRQAVRILTDDLGIPVVVSAGNDERLEVEDAVPATYPEVMAIASTTAKDGTNKCRYLSGKILADTASFFTTDGAFDSHTGIGVTISAPGNKQEDVRRSCYINSVGTLSLRLDGGTTRMYGTSMSAPHVTGVVALLMEKEGGLSLPEEIRDIIQTTASRIGGAPLDSPAVSYTFDGTREGILSACGALDEPCN